MGCVQSPEDISYQDEKGQGHLTSRAQATPEAGTLFFLENKKKEKKKRKGRAESAYLIAISLPHGW